MFKGNRLRTLRRKKKLSLTDLMFELAKNGMKVSRATLANWEEGKTSPKAGDLAVLAKFFKVSVNHFFSASVA